MRNQTLGEVLTMLRLELGDTSDPALGSSTRDAYIYRIKSEQQRLADDPGAEWPFLAYDWYIPVARGQRRYDFPRTMPWEKVSSVTYKWGDIWYPVEYGIDQVAEMASYDSDAGDRSDPVLRWAVTQDDQDVNQIEVWPIPDTDGRLYVDGPLDAPYEINRPITGSSVLRVSGIRDPRPLVSEGDRLDMDDLLVVYYAAAEILTGRKSERARTMLSKAKARLQDLQYRQRKTYTAIMGSPAPSRRLTITDRVNAAAWAGKPGA